jgi:hypothetical protein
MAEEQKPQEEHVQERAPEQHFEEHFSDVFWFSINPWSCILTFGLRATTSEDEDKPTIRMRMPLQQAKALAVILLRNLRQYEQENEADIDLPKKVLKHLSIAQEDWTRFKAK